MRASRTVLLAAVLLAACGQSSGGIDAGDDAGADADMSFSGPPGKACFALLTCDQVCSSDACTDQCYADSTAVAQGLFDALNDCISATCSDGPGGPCEHGGSTCDDCNRDAATGPCSAKLLSCENDSTVAPPNPDGGATVPDGGSATLNCGELIACVAGCPTGDAACATACRSRATQEAVTLESVLDACLESACPSAPGGPCATPGDACNGCIEQVELAIPNTCADPFTACQMDTSSSPDAGYVPTALHGRLVSTAVTGLHQCASHLVARDDRLYFTEVIDGSPVWQYDTRTQAIVKLGPGLPTPVGLAVDAHDAYAWAVGTFALNAATNNKDGSVTRVPLDGGPATTIVAANEVLYDAAYVNSITNDDDNVYWVVGAIGDDGTIMKYVKATGVAAPLYTQQKIPQAVTTDGVNVYWANWGTFNAQGLSNNDGSIVQGPVGGGTPIVLATGQPAPSSMTVGGGFVYWTDLGPLGGANLPAPNTGTVMRVPIGGGTVTTMASAQAVPVSITLSRGSLYWTQYGFSVPGLIMGMRTDGGPAIPLVTGLNDPLDLAVSGSTLYWTNTPSSDGGGSILSLSRL